MSQEKGVAFVKAHACGNDFLIVEEAAARGEHVALARRLCARHTGVGADGIEFLERTQAGPQGSGWFLRLFNADGSEAELSGNGTRCVAAWLAESEGLREVVLGTRAGERHCRVVARSADRTWQIETSMGVPQLKAEHIELPGISEVIEGVVVDMGNPHFVIFSEAEDFASHGTSWQHLGSLISTDRRFPRGTNVEFVRVLAPDRIAFRIFERGCGPTMSSGTGTSASSAAAIALRGLESTVTAEAEGGPQVVQWVEQGSELLLTGPAELICQGVAAFG